MIKVKYSNMGVAVFESFRFEDDRGRLGEIWTNDDGPLDTQHVYWTHCRPGVVKAWHYHNHQTDKFHCVKGTFKVLVVAENSNPPGNVWCEIIMSEYDSKTVCIPKTLWHGFANIGEDDAIMINCSTNAYNNEIPDEVRRSWTEILGPDVWRINNG